MSRIRCIGLLAIRLWSLLCVAAAVSAEPKTQIRLLLSADTARPGDTVWAGLQMDMPPGWHTYWRNGGDAGQPTEIKWTLPAGITAGDINWPAPVKEIDTAGDTALITYVYTNRVVLLVPLTLEKSLPPGPISITANAKWMECSDLCVIANGDVVAELNIGDTPKPSADAAAIEQWRGQVPQPDRESLAAAYWDVEPPKDNTRGLLIEWKTNAPPADFYPYGSTNFDVLGTLDEFPSSVGLILRKTVKKSEGEWPKEVVGVLAGNIGLSNHFAMEERMVIQPSAASILAKVGGGSHGGGSLAFMLFLAFVGGLILNVMPCVLPVIALKVLGFVSQSNEHPRRVKQLGMVYGLGVLVSFLVLALLAVGVQRAGGLANWGDLFRNAQFQIILTALMTLVALNLFGVFEITLSGKALGAASELSGKAGFPGAFFNGVLATVLATPCTAPFLGVALAFAFTQPPLVTILVFLAAGLGLAFPFVVICFNPRLMQFLPKPGAWMEKFKNAMGFPMLATAVWLMWVSASKEDDVLWIGLFLVVLSLVAWIWGQFVQRGSKRRGLAVVICLLFLGAGYEVILEGELQWRSSPQDKKTGIDWQVWSPEAVEQARRAGHPVLVDFTAKSCLTCKLNLASSIEIDGTRAKLKEMNAVAFKADDTLDDPAIARELRKFNTSGVPLVLVFSTNISTPPQVLPTFLTPAIVLAALDKAAR
jgi:thiol:disulfide interchange protein DsbD